MTFATDGEPEPTQVASVELIDVDGNSTGSVVLSNPPVRVVEGVSGAGFVFGFVLKRTSSHAAPHVGYRRRRGGGTIVFGCHLVQSDRWSVDEKVAVER